MAAEDGTYTYMMEVNGQMVPIVMNTDGRFADQREQFERVAAVPRPQPPPPPPPHRFEDETGVCRSHDMINVLDLPRWSMKGHMGYVKNGFKKPTAENTKVWPHEGHEIGGVLAVQGGIRNFGATWCCPKGTTWIMAKREEAYDYNRVTDKIHCCSGFNLPRNRFEAFKRYDEGCFGGRHGTEEGRGQHMLGYAQPKWHAQPQLGTPPRGEEPAQLDATTNEVASDEVTPYAADEAGDDAAPADGGYADADGGYADAFGGEDVLSEAPAPLEAAAAPAAEHLL